MVHAASLAGAPTIVVLCLVCVCDCGPPFVPLQIEWLRAERPALGALVAGSMPGWEERFWKDAGFATKVPWVQ